MNMPSDTEKTKNQGRFNAPWSKWLRFSVWTTTAVAFSLWTSSGLWLLTIPLFLDVYVCRYLPWGLWKKIKNKTIRTIFDWLDAIVYALVAFYVVSIYFFQNYQIPSSSLEKTLLVGDFLFVSKMSYGPRVPNTPISFPLAQHTLPILNIRSYLEKPHWNYKRVPGFGNVKRNDIVVFNFPAGDTVAIKYQQMTDFYTLRRFVADGYQLSDALADQYIRSHEKEFGQVIYRPVDHRENYVKRCIGLPGETLKIVNNQVYINNQKVADHAGVQYNYYVQTKGELISKSTFRKWGISEEDDSLITDNNPLMDYLPFKKTKEGKRNPVYLLPATQKILEEIRNSSAIDTVFIEPDVIAGQNLGGTTYPLNSRFHWTRDHFGPLWIPSKGASIRLTTDNILLYGRVIRNYEGHQLVQKAGEAYVDGKKTDRYTFAMDYYWMMGDNRHKSADSRSWGFVPEDHIVGKPICVWLSLDKDRKWLDGKIRWNRFFKKAY